MFAIECRESRLGTGTISTAAKLFLRPNVDIVIGRIPNEGPHVVVPFEAVSRKHAIIRVEHEINSTLKRPARIFITDLQSKCYTYVNGQQVQGRRELQCGDKIKFALYPTEYVVCREPIVVVASCLAPDEKSALQKHIDAVAGQLHNDWSPQCTYLCMNNITVTVKAIYAMINSTPFVIPSFFKELDESLALNGTCAQLPDTKKFIPPIGEAQLMNTNVSFLPNPTRREVFSGKTVYFFSSAQMSKFRSIIEMAGGRCLVLTSDVALDKVCQKQSFVMFPTVALDSPTNKGTYQQASQLIKRASKRLISEVEIGMAIIHSSTETYCNPDVPNSCVLNSSFISTQSQVSPKRALAAPKSPQKKSPPKSVANVVSPGRRGRKRRPSIEEIVLADDDDAECNESKSSSSATKRSRRLAEKEPVRYTQIDDDEAEIIEDPEIEIECVVGSSTRTRRSVASKVVKKEPRVSPLKVKLSPKKKGAEEFVVERIMDERMREDTHLEYRVRWAAPYNIEEEDTWEPEENVENCAALRAWIKLKEQRRKDEETIRERERRQRELLEEQRPSLDELSQPVANPEVVEFLAADEEEESSNLFELKEEPPVVDGEQMEHEGEESRSKDGDGQQEHENEREVKMEPLTQNVVRSPVKLKRESSQMDLPSPSKKDVVVFASLLRPTPPACSTDIRVSVVNFKKFRKAPGQRVTTAPIERIEEFVVYAPKNGMISQQQNIDEMFGDNDRRSPILNGREDGDSDGFDEDRGLRMIKREDFVNDVGQNEISFASDALVRDADVTSSLAPSVSGDSTVSERKRVRREEFF